MTISARLHRLLFGNDHHMSLCARAWWKQGHSRFWRVWVKVFGRRHCYDSWMWYYGDKE